MSELLPTVQAGNVRRALVDYLTTTFALSDDDARDGLDRFLKDPADGMFKGPYIRLRLPFRPAEAGWRESLEWYEGFPPYGHQAAAFARLSSCIAGVPRRPQPTLVTTGTGSGKTEAFLHPIVDHVLRARRRGISGTKALILYPMNALANDQAQRLASMIAGHPELGAITAALFTGQQEDAPRKCVTADGLITDRELIRDRAPDILLTNYKMLDQLLLRAEDQRLWRASATSLQYLVVDEFHTYDGAQGTDVAMLLRRLGLTLKSHWSCDDPALTETDWSRPLGRLTAVATSATLGDKGDPEAMLSFAETVFGHSFDQDAVITETRLSLAEWVGDAAETVAAQGLQAIPPAGIDVAVATAAVNALGSDPTGVHLTATVLQHLYTGQVSANPEPGQLLDLLRAHPLVAAMAEHAGDAIALGDLARSVLGADAATVLAAPGADRNWQLILAAVVAALGHLRAVAGRAALTVEAHLWVRELTRIDRAADSTAQFRWGDDGPPVAGPDGGDIAEPRPSFPAVFCRECGRSGWGIGLAAVGHDLAGTDTTIRRDHVRREGRFRAVLYAAREADGSLRGQRIDGLAWFSVRSRQLLFVQPDENDPDLRDGWVLPVLTTEGPDADDDARKDTCPSCGQQDTIRFLGSAIATLLSVSLSTLFGSATLDSREKKALVFTDSVQDAAHRAGFIQARSHTLTLRAVWQDALTGGPQTLDALVDEVIRSAGDDPIARYRILPPDCADRDSFLPFWQAPTAKAVPAKVLARVRRRLALDAALEFGLNSRTGRTLELTGSASAEIAADHDQLTAATRAAIDGVSWPPRLDGTTGAPVEKTLLQWVLGVLDRMRAQGAIDHPWFDRYRRDDGHRYSIWGGRPRAQGMPAFPRDRPAPAYPRVGGARPAAGRARGAAAADGGLDAVTSPQSWYARWGSRVLDVSPPDAGRVTKQLLALLAGARVLQKSDSASGAAVYAIPPIAVLVAAIHEADAGRYLLVCDTCQAQTPGSAATVATLDGAPCLVVRCRGRLVRGKPAGDFYRQLYRSTDMRRIVAREHTSLLSDETRRRYEDGFKAPATEPQAPNVLVATPTLEMGIDIGDLSTVLLASLPRTVASYLQRVGRAGRLNGNALDLAYVTGRGEQLPQLGEPLSVINGQVRPPATYLRAEEILRRQYTAHLVDELARDSTRHQPWRAAGAIGSSEPGSFLGELTAHAERGAEYHVPRFLAQFDGLPGDVADRLRDWVLPPAGPGSSDFAAQLRRASATWRATVAELRRRLDVIDAVQPELEVRAGSPAVTDEDKRALRSVISARILTNAQLATLRGEYWIGVLEQYGVLPNYTLLGDAVVLDVGISWINPDTDEYEYEPAQIARSSATAIREFAPGSTFYARGLEIAIDAIDLGLDGSAIRPWVFCPRCGFGADVALGGVETVPTSCPRCGSPDLADTGQRIDVVELTHVSAEVRRDEATISDRTDERLRTSFQLVTAVDLHPAAIVRRWFATNTGIGATYAAEVTLRWVNIGLAGHGQDRFIAGELRPGALFRVCAGCGKLDVELGRNVAYEHRPWCRYRMATQAHNRLVALTRTLRTQGLLIRLPRTVTVGDDYAVPSLAAAVLLGLREQIGGHPDHLRVEQVVEPTLADGNANHDAILLHDIVPGGTGYLADLAEPAALAALLGLAWERVRDCECRFENRLACHRCLLPFVTGIAVNRVSRAAAERHLRTLLGLAPDATGPTGARWDVGDPPADEDPESHLEQQFREVLGAQLAGLGAAIDTVPGPWGNSLRFTLPGSPRRWTLTPQVLVQNTRPDFVLQTNDTQVPALAVFVDGRAFHASTQHNRLASDAEQRASLRASGHVVLALTAADLTDPAPPSWFIEATVRQLIAQPQMMTSPAAYQRLQCAPVDWLLAWITAPAPEETKVTARAAPLFLLGAATPLTVTADCALETVAADVLSDAASPAGARPVAVWRDGPLAAAIELVAGTVRVAVLLDDRPEALSGTHPDGWRAWLRLSNALALRDWPTVITTVTLVAARVEVTPSPTVDGEVPPAWMQLVQDARKGVERDTVRALAVAPGVAAPVLGFEGPEGIPVDIAWPQVRLAIAVDGMPDADREDLRAAGWTVLDPTDSVIDQVVDALKAGN